MKKLLQNFLFLMLAAGFSACGTGEKPEDIISEEEKIVPSLEVSRFNAQNVFNTLPDRQLVMRLIEENKIEYRPELLNDPQKVKKYSIEFSRALNLGTYGSDLSISSSFNQTQESMVFLRCVNVLAQNLGVSSAFDQRLFERIEAHGNNKDSIIEVVTEAYKKIDEILKYNNRPATSAIILAGCWVEGLYVSCNIAMVVDQEKVTKAIINQKESLKNLIVMLEAVKLDNESQFLLHDLHELQKEFVKADESGKLTKETIDPITTQINSLRAKVVAPK